MRNRVASRSVEQGQAVAAVLRAGRHLRNGWQQRLGASEPHLCQVRQQLTAHATLQAHFEARRYCSSDIWSGDAPASNSTFGYTFRGSRIVTAVMNGLLQNQGLGATPGQRLLFGGCSAGAIGAMNNIEAVAAMMPSTVQTWGFLDGAGLLDIQPRGWNWRPYLETLQSLMSEMLGFSQPVFQPYCAQMFPGELWKCLIGCVPTLALALSHAHAMRVVPLQPIPHAAHHRRALLCQRAPV